MEEKKRGSRKSIHSKTQKSLQELKIMGAEIKQKKVNRELEGTGIERRTKKILKGRRFF